ncbi:MAG: hypothetical protein H6507_04920 [Calditrichaeota bacterium]|nr:hypothetical protein [Calditrichota bacterium]
MTSYVRLLVPALLLLALGCAQRDTDAGSDAIPVKPVDYEGQTLIAATRSAEWTRNLSNGSSATMQVGEDAAFKAVTALRYLPNEILPDSFHLDTVRIRFRVDQVYPGRGEAPDLRMLIKRITEYWSEDSLFSESLPNRDSYPVIDTLLLPTSVLDTATSVPPAVYWYVPDSIFEIWRGPDSANFGILLEADNPNVIVSLQSAEGATDYVTQLELIGQEFPEDSGFAAYDWSEALYAVDDGYLAVDQSDSLAGRLRISQGVHRRALLYFPLDEVTAHPFRSVVRAWIHLYADVDAPNTLTYTGQNFLYKDASLVDTTWFASPDSVLQNFIALSSSEFETDNREIRFEVTNSLVGMVGQPETNGGFSIQATLENDVLSRQYFYGHDGEVDSLRPRLEIWWVEQ